MVCPALTVKTASPSLKSVNELPPAELTSLSFTKNLVPEVISVKTKIEKLSGEPLVL